MSDDGVSSPPPDDFAEAPQVSLPGAAAGSVASAPPTRPPGARRRPPVKRKPAKPGKKKKAPKGKKRPAPKKRPGAKKRTGKKKGAKGGGKKR